jgi:hypothetical protein
MSLPWLRIIDGLLGLSEVVRTVKGRSASVDDRGQLVGGARGLGALETRLAGVVVAALKEAFDRDHQRLELEREQLEGERQRAERALRLELLRQAGDREMGRLRLLTGVAFVSWLSTLVLAVRGGAGALWPRIGLGLGWVLLLAALGMALAAQSRVARALAQLDDRSSVGDIAAAGSTAATPWLIVAGLAVIGFAVLLA